MTYPDWDEIRNSDVVRSRNFPMIEADMPTFMGLPLVRFPEDLKDADAVIIGAPYVAGWKDYAGVYVIMYMLAGRAQVKNNSRGN